MMRSDAQQIANAAMTAFSEIYGTVDSLTWAYMGADPPGKKRMQRYCEAWIPSRDFEDMPTEEIKERYVDAMAGALARSIPAGAEFFELELPNGVAFTARAKIGGASVRVCAGGPMLINGPNHPVQQEGYSLRFDVATLEPE